MNCTCTSNRKCAKCLEQARAERGLRVVAGVPWLNGKRVKA